MGAAHTMPGTQQPGPHVVQIRRRSADELQHLNSGYLRVSCCGGRVQIPATPHLGRRLLEDLIAMHELLLILSDEELYWVELESRRRFDFHNIGHPHLPRLVDPVFGDYLENQLRQWYGQHYEDRLARRIKSSGIFGWCVSPTERIFSSFIFAHELCLKKMELASIELSLRALNISTPLDFAAAQTAAKQSRKLLVVQFYEPWTSMSCTGAPPAIHREYAAAATDSDFSKHVIFKAIEVTREHLVWASTLAGAQDTPRPLVMQIRKRLPASPHSKSLLLEWGLALQSEVLEDEGGDLKTILFPASHACQEKCNPRKDLKTEDADLCFGVQHMLVGNLHADASTKSQPRRAGYPMWKVYFDMRPVASLGGQDQTHEKRNDHKRTCGLGSYMQPSDQQAANAALHSESTRHGKLGEVGVRLIGEGEVRELISNSIIRHVAGDFQAGEMRNLTNGASLDPVYGAWPEPLENEQPNASAHETVSPLRDGQTWV